MFAALSDEQRMLENTVGGVIAAAGLDERGDIAAGLWPRLAELGVLALPLPEARGGFGAGAVELAIVMRALGRVPGDTPFFASAVLGADLVCEFAGDALRDAILPDLLAGTARLAPALAEPGSRYDLAAVRTRARPVDAGYALGGTKSLVPCGAEASHFIVSARTGGADADRDGISLFLVPASAPGVGIIPHRAHDGTHDADVTFEDVVLDASALLGEAGAAWPAIARLENRAIAFSSAFAIGAMEQLQSETLDYLKTRRQFGATIGSFQVLQHAAVDMFIALEQAKAMAGYALSALEAGRDDPTLVLRGAKAHLNDAARFIGETAVQLHGAIGLTRECKAGRLFQRLTRYQLQFGDRAYCLGALAESDSSILAD
jgi:alkylation response protein AidB-like acyl-CoA dehydrogenase